MLTRYWSLSLILILTLADQPTALWARMSDPVVSKKTQSVNRRQERARQWQMHMENTRAAFSRGRHLLLASGVPFDPDFLLRPKWRKALAQRFATMPEMRTVKHGGPRLKGLYLADTLYLPNVVETEGDTVILVRKIIFEGGCGATIKGKGLIALFPIDPVETRISINEFRHLEQRQMFSHSFAPSTIASNLATFRRVGMYMQGQCSTSVNAIGTDRGQAAGGLYTPPAAPASGAGSSGTPGSCSGDPNGGIGGTGDQGSPGPNGGNGSKGIEGGPGGIIMCDIPDGSTASYSFNARGGHGEQGGDGAAGTPGSQGQKGGPGGPGANCCPSFRGNGGTGGTGGRGGPGGNGGRGGNGGSGGPGGTISITYPSNFQGSVSPNISGGDPGGVGGGGSVAPTSPGGEGGNSGESASGTCGTSSAGNPGQTGPQGLPGEGTLGPGQNPGSQGAQGSYNALARSSGDEDIDGDGFSPNEGDCNDTNTYYYPGQPPYCGGSSGEDYNCNGQADINEYGCHSPIIINFTGNLQLTNPDAGAWFDIAAVGIKRLLSWTRTDVDDAFLALDRNSNGVIDDGGELFGTRTRLMNDSYPAHNGFEALAEFDLPVAGGNNNGVIDPGDEKFSQLLVWQDRNHNGISEPSELRPLTATSIGRIDVEYFYSARRDRYGNEYRYRAKVYFHNERDSEDAASHQKWAYDVGLIVTR